MIIMKKTTYEDYLKKMRELAYRLKDEVLSKKEFSKIEFKFLDGEDQPPTIRLKISDKLLDCRLKEIQTSFVQNIWVGKVKDIFPDKHYLFFTRKEGHWLVISGETVISRGEIRISESTKDRRYTIERERVDFLETFLKRRIRKEKESKQKKMTEWFTRITK